MVILSNLEKSLIVELWSNNPQKETDVYIGHATLGIESLCKGPLHIDYQLTNTKFSTFFYSNTLETLPAVELVLTAQSSSNVCGA